MVLADGVVLGALAAVAGSALGIGAGAVILALLPSRTGRVPGPVTLVPAELTGIALLAVVSGVLAALVPAFLATRQPTAGVLASRRQPTRLSWRPAVAGLGCLAAAVVIGLGDVLASSGAPLVLVLAAALGEVGCALIAPALLAVIGRLAARLPLWPRLALRDASRNRSAAAPAVAAIIAVVAATAALLIFGATDATHDRLTYQPWVLVGDGVANLSPQQSAEAPEAAMQLRSDLPGADVLVVQGVGYGSCSGDMVIGGSGSPGTGTCRQPTVDPAPVPGCSMSPPIASGDGGAPSGALVYGAVGSNCPPPSVNGNLSTVLVDDGSTMARILDGAAAAAALRSGKSVVLGPASFDHGTATLSFSSGKPAQVTVPVVEVDSAVPLAAIVVPPSEDTPAEPRDQRCGGLRQRRSQPTLEPDTGSQP